MDRHFSVALTEQDRCILESYKTFVEGLSLYLGTGYEIALHSLENLDHSVIKIINGHYTGRTEGAPITDLALEMLELLRQDQHAPFITYPAKTKTGAPVKSTTIAIKGEGGRIIGLMCMNFYLDIPLSTFLKEYTLPDPSETSAETFAENAEEVIQKMVSQVSAAVYADKSILPSNKNKEIISRLYAQGVFQLKDSVGEVADLLGISRNTVYLHLRSASQR